MKFIYLTIISTLLFCDSQKGDYHDYDVLISIDNDPIVGIYDMQIITKMDTVPASYNLGRLSIEKADQIKITMCDEIVLRFKSNSNCPTIIDRVYETEIKNVYLIEGSYLWLRIYNFESFPKVFREDVGYGYEYDTPMESSRLPTKKNRNATGIPDCKK
jgi:hypothetical protein